MNLPLRYAFLVLWLLPGITFAQAFDPDYPRQQVNVNVHRPFDPVNPGFEVGYQRRILPRYAAQFTAGVLTDMLHLAPYKQYSGYRLSVEGRYLLPCRTRAVWPYVAYGVAYNKVRLTEVMQFTDSIEGYAHSPFPISYWHYPDTFSLHKQTVALNAIVGVTAAAGHFTLDIAGGLGAKYKEVVHSGRIDPADKLVPPDGYDRYYMASTAGRMLTPNVVFTIRIGYQF